MPIKATKPRAGRFNPSPETPVTQAQFNRGQQQLERMVGPARTQVNEFNRSYLALTQPYARAAELREGDAFRRQQEQAMQNELIGAPPPRGLIPDFGWAG